MPTLNAHLFKVSEYDQEIPRSQTADNPMAPQGTLDICFHKENYISYIVRRPFKNDFCALKIHGYHDNGM